MQLQFWSSSELISHKFQGQGTDLYKGPETYALDLSLAPEVEGQSHSESAQHRTHSFPEASNNQSTCRPHFMADL